MSRRIQTAISVCLIITGLFGKISFAQETVKKEPAFESESGFQRWMTEKPTGLYNNTTFAIISERGNLFSGMQTSFGYKFNPHLGIGGGIGIERFTELPTYSYYTTNFTLLPVFAELRYTVLKTKVTPVVAIQGGYKFLINEPTSQIDENLVWIFPPVAWSYYKSYDTYLYGGPFANLELGVNFKIYQRFGLYASVNYAIWSVSGEHHLWQYDYLGVDPDNMKVTVNEYVDNVLAYQSIFLFRLGFTF